MLGGIGHKFAISATAGYDCVDAEDFHVVEVSIPLGLAPVLMGDVVRNLIEESAGNRESTLFDEQLGVLAGKVCSRKRRIVAFLDNTFLSLSFLTA